jgi:outer membrane protein assembly factor BamA
MCSPNWLGRGTFANIRVPRIARRRNICGILARVFLWRERGEAIIFACMHRSCLLPWVFCLAALSVSASAQKYTPRKITFSGTTANQAELLAVSGLKLGDSLDQTAIQAAAQKLIDTGLFSDVRFSFDGIDLNYALKPAPEMEPVTYANFPWWDEQALNAAVAAKVPLFHGPVPPESAMQQQVAAALTALLAEKGVQATVTALPAKDETMKDAGVQFHIDAPPVEIGVVNFASVSSAWTDPVAAIGKAATGQDFDPATEATLETALRAIYHRQGYLDVGLTNFAHGAPQLADDKVMVPVSATVVEGAQYKLSGLHLSGDVLMTPADFAKSAKIHPGDIANEDLLRGTLATIAGPYRAHGYLRAKIDATPTKDPANHTVDYAINVEPGPVFHMGALSLVNLNDAQRAQVLQYWPLKQGDVYDAVLVPQFLLKYKNQLHSLDGWSAGYKQYEHEDTHVVDLVVTFKPGGALN